ncbi:MAG: hypothetical protein R3E67_03460 [Pseudomonadales bacterium]
MAIWSITPAPLRWDGTRWLRQNVGMRINYRKFLSVYRKQSANAGLRAPDIIYDIYGWGETTPC